MCYDTYTVSGGCNTTRESVRMEERLTDFLQSATNEDVRQLIELLKTLGGYDEFVESLSLLLV